MQENNSINFKSAFCLESWINENSPQILVSIRTTKCSKWIKWQEDSSLHIFPCACPIRNPECIFIETYYKLENALEIIRNEAVYNEALKTHHKIKNNPNALIEWAKTHEQLGLAIIHLEPIIKIKIQAQPYLSKSIELPANDISQLLKFKEVFTECYYSEQYENY